jgi:hypothetical protein
MMSTYDFYKMSTFDFYGTVHNGSVLLQISNVTFSQFEMSHLMMLSERM